VVLKGAAVLAIALGAFVSCEDETKMAKYRDGRAGWTISYPASMRRSPIDVYQGTVSEQGIVISSFGGIRKDNWLTFRRFPKDGVAFGVLQSGGGPMPDLSPSEQRFPLSRSDFSVESLAPPPRPLVHSMIANGEPWFVLAWFGPEASAGDKDKIWGIVESLRFPPQRPGTMSGDFYVLGDASRYPLAAVAKFPGKRLPDRWSSVPAFYLVHAPGGFYALGWDLKFERKCHMGFDRMRFAFFCATRKGWWNRIGEPLVSPAAGLMPDDALWLGQAKIGRDGHVLVGNWMGLGGPLFKQYERRFWPRVKPRAGSR
jgi:hypothetical protein